MFGCFIFVGSKEVAELSIRGFGYFGWAYMESFRCFGRDL